MFTPEGTFRIRFDLRHKLYWYYKEQRITNPDFRSPALGIVTGARTNPDVKQSGEEDLQYKARPEQALEVSTLLGGDKSACEGTP